MTSQPRMRKAGLLASDAGSRARTTVISSHHHKSASGDSPPCNINSKQSTRRSRSKNKLPKNIRYDLENALVGLCDVWFEEIKPHLVRNNIKLHIGEVSAGPDCGDYPRLPVGTSSCSHRHPECSASVCELCRLLFNAANSIESALSQASSAATIFASSAVAPAVNDVGSPETK